MALTKVDAQLLNGAVTADSSGNVGIGDVSQPTYGTVAIKTASSGLVTYTGSSAWSEIGSWSGVGNTVKSQLFADAYAGYVKVGARTNHYLALTTNDTERMRIDTSGNVLVGTSTAIDSAYRFNLLCSTVNGGGVIKSYSSGTAFPFLFVNSAGTQSGSISQSGTSTAFNTSSDYRLKENITPMQNALNVVQQLKPVTYTWKTDGSAGQGFIAHELQEVCPEAVTGEKDAVNEDGSIKPQGIDTSFLVATLTAAIQELKAELDATKAEVAAMKAGA